MKIIILILIGCFSFTLSSIAFSSGCGGQYGCAQSYYKDADGSGVCQGPTCDCSDPTCFQSNSCLSRTRCCEAFGDIGSR